MDFENLLKIMDLWILGIQGSSVVIDDGWQSYLNLKQFEAIYLLHVIKYKHLLQYINYWTLHENMKKKFQNIQYTYMRKI